jgi:hypothetical protein
MTTKLQLKKKKEKKKNVNGRHAGGPTDTYATEPFGFHEADTIQVHRAARVGKKKKSSISSHSCVLKTVLKTWCVNMLDGLARFDGHLSCLRVAMNEVFLSHFFQLP